MQGANYSKKLFLNVTNLPFFKQLGNTTKGDMNNRNSKSFSLKPNISQMRATFQNEEITGKTNKIQRIASG